MNSVLVAYIGGSILGLLMLISIALTIRYHDSRPTTSVEEPASVTPAPVTYVLGIFDKHGTMHLARGSDPAGKVFCNYGSRHLDEAHGRITMEVEQHISHVCNDCMEASAR